MIASLSATASFEREGDQCLSVVQLAFAGGVLECQVAQILLSERHNHKS